MTRNEIEDAILALLRPTLPPGVDVDSMPVREDEQKTRIMRGGAVWVTYAGGRYTAPTADFVQPGAWMWAICAHARDYRSPKDRGAAALDLLTQAEDAVVGQILDGHRVARVADNILPPLAPGIIGYELIITLDTSFRRIGG